ncbi:hypothetical protein JW752_00080 [Candidatus Peregrinibacteria bacterium]|nr:hypothetical protein [Candidatus Peregrinibacteria bacterium]
MAKNKKSKNTLKWLKDAFFKALIFPLLLVIGYYAHAAITWPGSDPNPVTGVVGMFVGESDSAYSTGVGYEDVNLYCQNHSNATIAGSHVCTPAEMTNSLNHGTIGVSPVFTYAGSTTLWINSGPPGYTANSNDCKGWTATDSPSGNPNYGTVWNFAEQYGGLLPCKTGKKYACCK